MGFQMADKCGIISPMNTSDKKNDFKNNTLGSRVRAVRNCLKISQKDFCKTMGISNTNLSKIENGKTLPGHDFFFNVLRLFDVNLNYLLGGEGAMFRSREAADAGGLVLSPAKFGDHVPTELVEEFLHRFLHSRYLQFLVMAKYVSIMDKKEDREVILNELKRMKDGKKK
jgi:transcriptional regulator with XRE-family HTH domain